MGITANSIAHVRLTVTDIERSRRFYESVFGWPVLLEVPDNADAATRNQLAFLFGGVIYDLGGGQWQIPELRTLLEKVLPGDISPWDFLRVLQDSTVLKPLLRARHRGREWQLQLRWSGRWKLLSHSQSAGVRL